MSTYNNKSRWQSDFINKKIDIIQNIDEFLGSLPAIIKNADKENIHLSAEAYYLIYDSIRKQLSLKV